MSREGHSAPGPSSESLLIVLSGVSGAGKDTVLAGVRASGFPIEFIVTATTRSPRANENDAVDYHFVSEARFQEMINQSELLEWARVYGNWYGVPKKPVKEALARKNDVIIKVDVQGAATIKNIVPQAVFIFLAPPSIEEMITRLKQRRTESPDELDLRTGTAEEELQKLPLFDYIVINRQGQIDRAVSEVEAIITAEKCRVKPREITL